MYASIVTKAPGIPTSLDMAILGPQGTNNPVRIFISLYLCPSSLYICLHLFHFYFPPSFQIRIGKVGGCRSRQLLHDLSASAPALVVDGGKSLRRTYYYMTLLFDQATGAALFHFNAIEVLFHSDCKYRYKRRTNRPIGSPPCVHHPAFAVAENSAANQASASQSAELCLFRRINSEIAKRNAPLPLISLNRQVK